VTLKHDGRTAADQSLGALYERHLEVWERRVAEALEGTGADGLAIFAGELLTSDRDDLPYPFRPEPYFKIWAPLTGHPGCWLRLVPGRRPRLVFLQEAGFWHAPAPDPEGFWVANLDIVFARTPADARTLIGTTQRLAALGPVRDVEGFASVNDAFILSRLDYHRAIKTEYESACITLANLRAVRGHAVLQDATTGCVSEFELQQLFCQATQQTESELPYPSIIALNERAAILHYQHQERVAPTQLRTCLVDAGAVCNGYAADVSRTWVGRAGADGDFAALRDAMEAMQNTIWVQAMPGLDFVELNERAHRHLAELLRQCALISCSAEDAYARGITRSFLPHGLGHLLGLQVHDRGGRQIDPDGAQRPPPATHPFLRLTRRLEAGFVVTIEPGLYFIPALLARLAASPEGRMIDWAAVERFLPYGGIRIEDNVLVTEKSAINLTRDAWSGTRA
jgi:Xaa-Pro dipeptidase